MKTTLKRISILYLLCISTAAFGQRFGNYAGISIQKEFDWMSNYAPYVGVATVKFGPLFLQGDVHYTSGRNMDVNYLDPTTSFGGRIGYLGGKADDGIKSFGFTAGYQHLTNYRKLHFDQTDYPIDVTGKPIEVEKVNIRCTGDQFSFGLTGLIVEINETGNLEAMIDDYDLEANKNKKRSSITQFSLEMLYMPKIAFDSTFNYNPWGYFVDRPATITAALKQRKFGVRIMASYAPYSYLGFTMEMGIYPGLKHSTENYNDFGIGVKAGFFVNLAAFSK